MKRDDPRHGSERGYMAHRRSKQRACDPCRRAFYDAQRARESEPVALTGGRWVPRGLVQVWQEAS